MLVRLIAKVLALPFALGLLASPALSAQCGGDFNRFIAEFSREAAGKGISQPVIAQAFGLNAAVISMPSSPISRERRRGRASRSR